MSLAPIKSDATLDQIEHHFRVTAGPGAGKTHWLANHICHVARTSQRLTPASRIAVISYTNVAVNELLERVGTAAQTADITTIHSFLFRNLVRPYLHFISDSEGSQPIAHALIDTHGEHYPSRKHLDTWLRGLGKERLLTKNSENKFDLLKDCLKALTIRVNKDQESYFVTCKQKIWSPEIVELLSPETIIRYKQHYWAAGSVDHEDVLYFAHQLLLRFPVLRRVLSSRFPYLFIDEFQDTIPVQAEIVNWLANEGTVVGVIGDPAQAIYGFIDATPNHFHEFDLDGHHTYSIQGNRRSTKTIVSLLNSIRTDGLEQKPLREDLGTPPIFYSGDLLKALGHAKQNSSHASEMLVLARSHKGVLQAKRAEANFVDDPWKKIAKTDVNRFRFLQHLITSVDLANRGFYELAMQRLVRGISTRNKFREPFRFSGEISTIQRKSFALSLLELMTSRKTELAIMTVLETYQLIQEHVGLELEGLSLPKAVRGKFFVTASKCNYSDLLSSIRTPEETRLIRTIHQAKGSEADAVFVILENDAADHILNPIADNEEHQITYVALSRARNELFIYCPDNDIWASPRMEEFTTSSIMHMNSETV